MGWVLKTADVEVTMTIRYHVEGDVISNDEFYNLSDSAVEKALSNNFVDLIEDDMGWIAEEPGCNFSVTVDHVKAVRNADA